MSTKDAEEIEADSRENSPEGHDGTLEKRTSKKRKVLSCFACRNRKMKCDRVYPVCGRCQRTGRADQCTYDPRLLEESLPNVSGLVDGNGVSLNAYNNAVNDNTNANASSADLQWKIKIQERRIEMLEQKLAAKNTRPDNSHFENHPQEEAKSKEEMMYRGKGFKTQFHGASSVMSLISQYRELQAFTRETLTVDHSINRVKTDFKTFRNRRKAASKQKEAEIKGTDEDMFNALPEKSYIDVQVALYFQIWETSYRILHEPSFWKEYVEFWEQYTGRSGQAGFAVTLLLIVATTKCLGPKDDVFVGDMTADRQAASSLIDLCDSWMNRQPRKRLTLQFFQLQCLALLAKRVNCVKLKQDWVTSGDIFRLALAAGMHRDPSLLASGRISEFEKEMKRRLWITIMEFELQSSLESGLQSSLSGLYFDTPAPSNLPDDSFATDTDEMPASRPSKHFTSSSYLVLTSKSLPLRIHLAQLLNNPGTDIQYSDVLHYDAQIHSILSALPSWEDERSAIPSALLHLQLKQYLLVLHRPYAKLAPNNQRYTYSFTTCVDIGSSIIATHDELAARGILALNNFRNDVIRVGLTLSQIVYHNCAKSGPFKPTTAPPPNPESHFADPQSHFGDLPSTKSWGSPDTPLMLSSLPKDSFLSRTLCSSSIEILERTRHIFEQKVMRLGTGYMEFWLLSAAVGMLPSIPSPATSIAYVTNANDDILSRCRTTLDRFTTLTFRVLALQKDPSNSFALSLRDTMASVSPSDGRTPSLSAGVAGAGSGMGTTPMAIGNTPLSGLPNINLATGINDGNKTLTGTYDVLQDMQVDMGGWSFPDFWAFDLGGDF